jgi:hypothetical protein
MVVVESRLGVFGYAMLALITNRSFFLLVPMPKIGNYFSGSSLILSPPLATGITQMGVPSGDALKNEM